MYIILVENDNSLYASKKERIMQKSKLVDTLWFLVPQFYKEQDMSEYTVQLEYILPCSKEYHTEILELSDEMYKDHLKYTIPFDTKLTKENGVVQLQLTFAKTELDENGKGVQYVRKTSVGTIEVIPLTAWSSIIPDSALEAIDQRLIKLDTQMRGLADLAEALDYNQVDNLVYDKTEDVLQLMAGNVGVGNKVSVKEMLDDVVEDGDCDCYEIVEF